MYLHLFCSDVLVIVLEHVGEECGVVGHAMTPLHLHRLTREQSVARAGVQQEESDAEPQQDPHGGRRSRLPMIQSSPDDSGGSASHQRESNLQEDTISTLTHEDEYETII